MNTYTSQVLGLPWYHAHIVLILVKQSSCLQLLTTWIFSEGTRCCMHHSNMFAITVRQIHLACVSLQIEHMQSTLHWWMCTWCPHAIIQTLSREMKNIHVRRQYDCTSCTPLTNANPVCPMPIQFHRLNFNYKIPWHSSSTIPCLELK